MSSTHRSLSEDIPAPPADVRAFYVDFDNLSAIHPLVVSVRSAGRTPYVQGYQQDYRIVDRIRMGPFTMRTAYRARLSVPPAGDVTAEARQFPGVRLRTRVEFVATDAGTRVTEHITVDAPRPLAAFTVREATSAHREMLAGIRRRFEN
ncbi:SRPBCC family protein [Mycobacterium sp. 1164985.4]|uniref:SRPBCC family protein n=1 Tax=Mycobacterium sp. 1164985.4 TaxID=1834069 RepID=UPI0008005241|nr:SRPBCC family protein [Mycobacterium sp. 1164985.4]OBK81176.1 polyketide cyclase / dehydrase and lipid transport [Mycobacterium sp. 1164985.4]